MQAHICVSFALCWLHHRIITIPTITTTTTTTTTAVSSVTNMYRMFYGATSFNQDTSSWTSKDFELLPFIDKKKCDKSFILSFPLICPPNMPRAPFLVFLILRLSPPTNPNTHTHTHNHMSAFPQSPASRLSKRCSSVLPPSTRPSAGTFPRTLPPPTCSPAVPDPSAPRARTPWQIRPRCKPPSVLVQRLNHSGEHLRSYQMLGHERRHGHVSSVQSRRCGRE